MIILLILYLIFIFIYVAFNIYGILRIWAMRIKGDRTAAIILFYLFAIGVIFFFSFIFIISLDWSTRFNLPGIGG